MTARGNSPEVAREFLRNTTFTPTLQLLFVDALEPLGKIKGEEGLLKIAIGARSQAHALFLIQQLRIGLACSHHHDRVLASGHALLRSAVEQAIQAIQHGESIGAVHAHIQMLGRTVDAQMTQFVLRSVAHRQRLADLAFALHC